ncbi:MAG: hypothetical protein ABI700_33130, partial [Chloroflexota bacterium]
MAVQTKTVRKARTQTAVKTSKAKTRRKEPAQSSSLIRLLPGWIIVGFVLVILLPHALSATLSMAGHTITNLPRTVGV